MSDFSLAPMKFGDEDDFETATTELKWIAKTLGKITDKDIGCVASKYNFPVDFLQYGLNGLQYPDDYRISKSKWFPIIFSWQRQSRPPFPLNA